MSVFAANDANMQQEDPPYPTFRGTKHGDMHGEFVWLPRGVYNQLAGQWTPTGAYTWHYAPPSGLTFKVAALTAGYYFIPGVMGSKTSDDFAYADVKGRCVEQNFYELSNWSLFYLFIAYSALVIILTCYGIFKYYYTREPEKHLRDVQVQSPTTYTILRKTEKARFHFFENWDRGVLYTNVKDVNTIVGNSVVWFSDVYTWKGKTKHRHSVPLEEADMRTPLRPLYR